MTSYIMISLFVSGRGMGRGFFYRLVRVNLLISLYDLRSGYLLFNFCLPNHRDLLGPPVSKRSSSPPQHEKKYPFF